VSPRGVALALCLGALCRAARADACDERDRDAAIARANQLRAAGDADGALSALRDLWGRCPEARVLVQMALAEHSASRWFDAWRHMNEALATRGDAWIDARRSVIERARDVCREHLATVVVESDTRGAELSIEAQEAVALPLAHPLVVAPGSLTLEVRAPGHRAQQRTVTAQEGQTLREVFALVPEALTAPVVPEPTPELTPAPSPPPRPSSALRYAGIAVTALGVGAIAFGVSQWAETASINDGLAGAAYDGPEPYASARRYLDRTGAEGYCDRAAAQRGVDPAAAQAQSVCDAHGTAQAMALAFGLGGVALAGAGVAMIALGGPRAHAVTTRVTVVPWIAAGTGGATALATF
jgi:hypothetical protein